MAVTKILARHARLDLATNYAVNPDKTDEEVLTTYLNCDKGHACHQMLATKEAKNNRDGVQYYHITYPVVCVSPVPGRFFEPFSRLPYPARLP